MLKTANVSSSEKEPEQEPFQNKTDEEKQNNELKDTKRLNRAAESSNTFYIHTHPL